jgi:protein gp37
MSKTNISMYDYTYNPFVGCTKHSEGCKFCYAEPMSFRLKQSGHEYYSKAVDDKGLFVNKTFINKPAFDNPRKDLSYREGKRVFVCAMSDLFHEYNKFEDIHKVFLNLFRYPKNQYYILTKRPEIMIQFISEYFAHGFYSRDLCFGTMLSVHNIYFGVTIENNKNVYKLKYLEHLKKANIKTFISFEPLLEDISNNIRIILDDDAKPDLAIIGTDSGPGKRYCDTAFVRNLAEVIKANNILLFVKQIHSKINDNGNFKVLKYMCDFPSDLKYQGMPIFNTLKHKQ